MVRTTQAALAVLLVMMLATASLSACAQEQEPTAVEPATEQIEQNTEQKKETVDEVLISARDAVDKLVAAVGGLEARVDGLQISSDLREVQRQLTRAIELAGEDRVAALEELSGAFSGLIETVETAAGNVPEGGVLQTELTDFANKLKAVQADVAEAAASTSASSTPSP